ncbi:MAG: invasion associated locus B family protein [Rhodobacteraceae bacterium]|nr:invasion associated locus B family protein [Paracoccaceae bacterium]
MTKRRSAGSKPLAQRLRTALVPSLFALVSASFLAPAAAAESGPLVQEPHGDWVLLRGAGICQLRHTILSAASGAVLLEMLLLPPGQGRDGALAGLRVPLGVSLPDGIAWRHRARPDEAIALAWQHCDPDLCLAAGEISRAELDRLRRGASIEVGFRPLPGANPVRIAVSLRGVTAGWRALEACEAGAG